MPNNIITFVLFITFGLLMMISGYMAGARKYMNILTKLCSDIVEAIKDGKHNPKE